MIVPPRRIVDGDPKLGFEDLDEPVAKPDRDRLADADPTELAEMGNIERNAHRTLPKMVLLLPLLHSNGPQVAVASGPPPAEPLSG